MIIGGDHSSVRIELFKSILRLWDWDAEKKTPPPRHFLLSLFHYKLISQSYWKQKQKLSAQRIGKTKIESSSKETYKNTNFEQFEFQGGVK